jgi:LmbE family N-acetylglucosaminyl deacetylase
VLGCGGTIARYVNDGIPVAVCIVSSHDEPLYSKEHSEITKREALEAHRVLGVSKTYFIGFSAVTLKDLPAYELNGRILDVVEEVSPTIVYIPHVGDMHSDHSSVSQASLVALRPLMNSSVTSVYSYETLSETEWNSPRVENVFLPNTYIDITEFIERKLSAMACYQSQLYDAPHPRSLRAISSLAALRGSTISVDAAESFSLIRSVRR